ncbi:MAG: radical SAM protein [Phycisphaerales bacterium]|nr:radical SAM protein [Phycisphaerales bacterium]
MSIKKPLSFIHSPYLLYADNKGQIFEDDSLYAVGRLVYDAVPIPLEDWIELPDGGNLYELPQRQAIGIDVKTGEMRLCTKGVAVAAFIPPAHTGLYLAAYETANNAPTLPLFAYTAVGWYQNKFYVPAVRIEKDIRQESSGYSKSAIALGSKQLLKNYPKNRLVQHLMDNCCNTYHCPAARNLSLGRWECPIPTSPACNANCIGCISFQPATETIVSTQDRLTFKPTVAEIVEFTVPHLLSAPYPIISFGQGCEGEPLLMWETIRDAIIEIRKHTDKGTININTNGSKPNAIEALCKAGLNSARISTNSLQPSIYEAYYRPNNYQFNDIVESLKILHQYKRWSSINYFVFPGLTDSEQEYQALRKCIKGTHLKMIQWRNFNIDPDWYLSKLPINHEQIYLGMKQLFNLLNNEFPKLRFGYFNPPIERIMGNFEKDFARIEE